MTNETESDERPILVWTTWPDTAAAEAASGALVERRLAACAVMLPDLRSVYRWQGRVESATEVGLLLKTRSGLAEALTAAIVEIHPYEVPAVLVIDTLSAAAAYAAWIVAETAPDGAAS